MKHIFLPLSVSFFIIFDALYSWIFNYFQDFSLQTLRFICVIPLIILMSNVLVTERPFRWSCKQRASMFLVYFKSGQSCGFTGIYQFEIFSVSDRIIHSLVAFVMFSAFLFMRQMWFFLNFKFLTKLLF